jgi:hypothetical protein
LQRGDDLPDVVEIGATWPAPAARRTPINTEAKLLMLTHAFEVWRVHRVSLMTDARNMSSRHAILRLGAKFDGVIRAARVAADGGIRDTAAFSIVESEWRAVKARLEAKLRWGSFERRLRRRPPGGRLRRGPSRPPPTRMRGEAPLRVRESGGSSAGREG